MCVYICIYKKRDTKLIVPRTPIPKPRTRKPEAPIKQLLLNHIQSGQARLLQEQCSASPVYRGQSCQQ